MCGLLKIEAGGATPGNGAVGYDQVWVAGSSPHDVLLDGDLAITWSGAGWSSGSDRLWIIRNDTDGMLSGTFHGYPDGAVVGDYDGHSWRIYYGVDLDAISRPDRRGQRCPANVRNTDPRTEFSRFGHCRISCADMCLSASAFPRRGGELTGTDSYFSPF